VAVEYMKKLEVISLRVAMMVPFIYFGIIVLSALFYPGYSHMRQVISDLGASGTPHPEIFNVGVIITGAAILIGAFGFFRALQRLGARLMLTCLTSSVLVLFGLAGLLTGIFPWPDPRHGGKYLALVIIFGPMFLTAALWKRREARLLNMYSIGTNILMIGTIAIMTGIGGLVTRANVGLMQRISALTVFPWIGIAAYVLNVLVLRYTSPNTQIDCKTSCTLDSPRSDC